MTDPFSIPSFSFPKGFEFGSATAGHQIEGNNIHSNNYFDELEQKKINPKYDLSGLACNSYNMYEEDSKILSEFGHKVYRMSIEWSRIEPEEGSFLESEVDHYKKVFESLKERNIKICLSLNHGTVPQWFAEKGWFHKRENIRFFERYVEYVVPKICQYIDYWIVLNEPNGATDTTWFAFKFNAVLAHARANSIIKKYSKSPVSTSIMYVQQFAKRQNDRFDRMIQDFNDVVMHEYFFHAVRTGELVVPYYDAIYDPEIKNSCDFWAINSYNRRLVDARKKGFTADRYRHEKLQVLPEGNMGAGMFAECLIHNTTRLMDKPVYITECGCPAHDEDFSLVYLVEYLSAVSEAIEMGVDIRGFLYWSLLDNYEWGSYTPKFGLFKVDREGDFKRTPKKVAYLYRDIIQNGGYTPDMLKKYLNEMPRVKYGTEYKPTEAIGSKNVFQGGDA